MSSDASAASWSAAATASPGLPACRFLPTASPTPSCSPATQSSPAPSCTPGLHPTQLYEASGELLIFLGLLLALAPTQIPRHRRARLRLRLRDAPLSRRDLPRRPGPRLPLRGAPARPCHRPRPATQRPALPLDRPGKRPSRSWQGRRSSRSSSRGEMHRREHRGHRVLTREGSDLDPNPIPTLCPPALCGHISALAPRRRPLRAGHGHLGHAEGRALHGRARVEVVADGVDAFPQVVEVDRDE